MEKLKKGVIRNLAVMALAEDLGAGDATTLAVVPEHLQASAVLVSRQDCVCAGLAVAEAVFHEMDSQCRFIPAVADGDLCRSGTVMAEIEGKAQALLGGERTALNFIQRMSGIATLTRAYVEAAGKGRTRILDTRKTTPGLRLLEKYAVTAGGGSNHRFGLFDRVMIKDNHRQIAAMDGPGGILRAVRACRCKYPDLEIEVEADTLEDVEEAVKAGVDYILLDNMNDDEIGESLALIEGRISVEASGNITLDRVPVLAELGVDFISVGALTHSAPAVDLGLDIEL